MGNQRRRDRERDKESTKAKIGKSEVAASLRSCILNAGTYATFKRYIRLTLSYIECVGAHVVVVVACILNIVPLTS